MFLFTEGCFCVRVVFSTFSLSDFLFEERKELNFLKFDQQLVTLFSGDHKLRTTCSQWDPTLEDRAENSPKLKIFYLSLQGVVL